MASTHDRINGSITALITPFTAGKVDEAAFRKLVNWQIEQGTNGLVPCGTTGESPTLSHDEHARVIELCVEEAKGRFELDRRSHHAHAPCQGSWL
jgi:4-hydroxy-tetrahydrodipicolinate synthase